MASGAPSLPGNRVTVPTIQRNPRLRSPRGSASSAQLGSELAAAGFSPGDTSSLSRRQQVTIGQGSYDDLHSAVGTLESKIWFHGELSRDGTAERLMGARGGSMQRDGYFLVRRGRGGLVLSVLARGDVRHYVIIERGGKVCPTYGHVDRRAEALGNVILHGVDCKDCPGFVCALTRAQHSRAGGANCFSIDDGPRFPSVPGLVSFYRTSTEPLPIKLVSHCPNKSVATPHVMFGQYGVAWMSVGKNGDKAAAIVEGQFAQVIYDEVTAEMKQLARPNKAKSKFAAAARAIMAAKQISWNANREEIMKSVKDEELQDDKPANPKTARSNFHQRTIKRSNVIESKVYLSWLNKKLISAGSSVRIGNLFTDLRSGVIVMQLIQMVSGLSKPRHKENPASELQMQDNWHAIVKYMLRAGMPADKLDAIALFQQDQRMILKLFGILLNSEAKAALEEAKLSGKVA